MTDLLERLKTAFPNATFEEFKNLGNPCYIVSVDGVDLKVTELPKSEASNKPSAMDGMLPRGPIWHNKTPDDY